MTLARTKTFRDLPVLGFRKNGKPIYPIIGGEDSPDAAAQAAAAAAAAGNPPTNQPKPEARDESGIGLGFPSETKVEDMNADQRAMYWRNEAKKQQKKVPSNLADLQTKAQQWDDYQKSQKPPEQQAIDQTRSETEARVRAEVAKDSVVALLRTTLHTRGKNATEIDELVEFVSPERFLTAENKLDTAKVVGYLDKIAPSGSVGGGLPGQGRQEQVATDRFAKGKEEAERRGFKPADRSTSTLIPKQ